MTLDNEIEELKEEGYYLTEFNLVNPTTQPIIYDLFNTNTLATIQTIPNPLLPPSLIGSALSFSALSVCDIVFCPTNNNMYVPDYLTGIVRILDINNNILSTISIAGEFPRGMVYCPANDCVYVCFGGGLNGTIAVINCVTNTLVDTITVSINPSQITYNSLNNTLYLTHESASGGVTVINCFNNAVITFIPDIYVSNTFGVAYNSLNNTIYFTSIFQGTISVIDCATNTIIGSPITVGTQPSVLKYNRINNVIYCSDDISTNIYVIDCSSNSVIATVPIGSGCDGLLHVPSFNYLYVSCRDTGELITINGATNSIIGSALVIGGTPFGLGYSEANNNVYVSNGSINVTTIVPSASTVNYITGSFNYNQFIQDIQDNPILVKCALIVSSNQSNISQVFFTTVKNANGQSASVPVYPQLSISSNQMQSSVSKVCFGEGFILDEESFFSNFTVQPVSSIKLIIIQKQTKKSDSLGNENDTCNQLNMVRNSIQEVKGVDAYNNIEFHQIIQIQPIRPKRPIKHETTRPISVKPVTEQVRPIKHETPRQITETKVLKK